MGQQRIDLTQEFAAPVSRVFAHLSEHENLEAVFAPAKIKRIKNGLNARNGVGSVRELRILVGPPFQETVTAFKDNELIEYRITQGSPLKNHLGVMRFSPTAQGGTRLDYTITFEGKFPLVAEVIRPPLESAIRRGLRKLKV
jgi:uncharacterized protein YndB with AHSA1/START domain